VVVVIENAGDVIPLHFPRAPYYIWRSAAVKMVLLSTLAFLMILLLKAAYCKYTRMNKK